MFRTLVTSTTFLAVLFEFANANCQAQTQITAYDACSETCYGKDNTKCIDDADNNCDSGGTWKCSGGYLPMKRGFENGYAATSAFLFSCCQKVKDDGTLDDMPSVITGKTVSAVVGVTLGLGAAAGGAYGIYACVENDCLSPDKTPERMAEKEKVKDLTLKYKDRELLCQLNDGMSCRQKTLEELVQDDERRADGLPPIVRVDEGLTQEEKTFYNKMDKFEEWLAKEAEDHAKKEEYFRRTNPERAEKILDAMKEKMKEKEKKERKIQGLDFHSVHQVAFDQLDSSSILGVHDQTVGSTHAHVALGVGLLTLSIGVCAYACYFAWMLHRKRPEAPGALETHLAAKSDEEGEPGRSAEEGKERAAEPVGILHVFDNTVQATGGLLEERVTAGDMSWTRSEASSFPTVSTLREHGMGRDKALVNFEAPSADLERISLEATGLEGAHAVYTNDIGLDSSGWL